jgi:hypothetical protein
VLLTPCIFVLSTAESNRQRANICWLVLDRLSSARE